MIKWKQGLAGFQDWGLDLENPDFVKLAEAYGARGYRVEKADDFAAILKQCLETDGTHLIEVPFSYEWMAKELTKVPDMAEKVVGQLKKEFGECIFEQCNVLED